MKFLIIAVAALMLTGCLSTKNRQPTIVTVPEPMLIEIPEDLLRCTGVRYPDPDTLTDAQVAKLIVDLEASRARCGANLNAIREYQDRLRQSLQSS